MKETNEPIPGLIVSIRARDGAKPTASKRAHAALPKLSLRGFGSAITGDRGEFRIEVEQAPGAAASAESAVEVNLAVLAPSSPNDGSAAVSKEHVICWLALPPLHHGQSEAVVVHVLEKQLDRFDLTLPGRQPKAEPEAAAAHLLKAERERRRFRIALNEALEPMRNELIARRRRTKEAARGFARPLSAVSKSARRQATWVASGESAADAARNAMDQGLKRIRTLSAERDAAMRVTFTPGVLGRFVRPDTVTVEGLEIDHDRLCAMLNARRGGPGMVRVRELLDAFEEERAAEKRLQRPGPHSNGGSGSLVTPRVDADPSAEVVRRVLGQIRDLPTEGAADGWDEAGRLTIDGLNAMLPGVRLGAGPADTPAFHDFYNLQIAFPHVWTEAFDGELRADVEALYETYAELHEEFGQVFSERASLEEIRDLETFLHELGSDSAGLSSVTVLSAYTKQCLEGLGYSVDNLQFLNVAQQESVNELAAAWWPTYARDPNDRRARAAIATIRQLLDNPASIRTRLERLLYQVRNRLNEPYAFHYFAPNTVNFGLLLTYRQLWKPGPYQVGDLVSTIPLAPGEKRKYSTTQTVKRTRAETEVEKAMASRSRELTTTRRVEAEITARASSRSNFRLTSEGSLRFAIGEVSCGTEFALDQSQESSSTKRDFHEAVLKAAQDYRQERSLQVNTTDERAAESTTSGELSNPNNELTVTYLLYELERQYTVSERIHRVTPVVLVAQDVPAPHEITESWLLANEWILRRVLLDDTLAPALGYLTEAFPGEELGVSIKKANWETQRELVAQLQTTVNDLLSARERFRAQLVASEEARARAEAAEEAQGWLSDLFENLSVGDFGELAVGDMEAKLKALQKQLEYLEEGVKEKREELALAREALEETTRTYTEALEAQTNRRVAIDQLRIHVKDNILYYMQAIWQHEPPDQRFFRLYHVEVPLPEAASRTCRLRRATPEEEASTLPLVRLEWDEHLYVVEGCQPPALPDPDSPVTKRLVEIADIDNPLGYKGNYVIFPLKTCVYLTDFMMREFFDDYFGIRDPDPAGDFTVEELLEYTEALLRDETVTLSEDQLEALRRMVLAKLRRPRRDSDLVVVPTGELFMEALIGEHPLLETFKLSHRAVDLAKARAEYREAELENLRHAARLLQSQPNLDDPDVDRHIVVEGVREVHVDTP